MQYVLRLSALLLLASVSSPASAAESAVAVAGFWSGFIDGFLSLLKLLLSPWLDVTLVADHFGAWGYAIGYYLGVVAFVGAAGAAASSENPEADEVRLEVGSKSRG